MSVQKRTRLAAYGVCIRDQRVLLARYVAREGNQRHWTLPGGGVEHGEDPYDAVVRELAEETGYLVGVERLLGVGTRNHHSPRRGRSGTDMHHVGIYYAVGINGGELRNEIDGSTDMADWVLLSDVPRLERAVVVDTGLRLASALPADGHLPAPAVEGLLRS